MTRQDIENNTTSFMRTAGGTRPDLRVVEINGKKTVAKDFRRSDLLFRLIVGPVMIGREREALSRLNGVPGVPRLVGSIDRYAFVMDYIDGVSLANYQGTVPEGFFDELAEIMRAVHARGVAHCDLRSSGNAVVTSEGRPYVVDFAACVMRGRGLNPFINFLFRQFSEADDHAILILKRKHAPDKLTPEDLDRLANPMPYERIAKAIGTGIRNVARKVLTGKRK